eukprot:CAMPEP_0197644656 /NCGR_PEP_ID=MMETSP1338-20131121/17563_1 /TAXON_ID=43686 ORGANISM="Pelagodinium beii, Strain RCC1491" /NCGR_SAMPLE_ID=MMETSP1338 /ASSEMBLY_ACC=CAM_ASM_000754 /LENGTH=51 /DNA_ID=CAMNT_0043218093 /DNA_START=94 /DNA_END=249 /DNA_ORIENTATION=+
MPETEEGKREPREEYTRHTLVIADQRTPGAYNEAQKKMDWYQQLLGGDKKK